MNLGGNEYYLWMDNSDMDGKDETKMNDVSENINKDEYNKLFFLSYINFSFLYSSFLNLKFFIFIPGVMNMWTLIDYLVLKVSVIHHIIQ